MDNKISLVRYLYYFSLLGLFIIYFFPGSIIGCFIYKDCQIQPDLIPNPLGTSINHLIAFFYLSIIGLISCIKKFSFNLTAIFLIILSFILELSHLIIPNRSFQYLDLMSNLFGTLLAITIIFLYKRIKNGKI